MTSMISATITLQLHRHGAWHDAAAFDMKDPGGIVRATRWACLGRNDLVPDWRAVCGAAAEGVMAPEDLMAALAAKEQFVRALPGIARRHGVNEEVIDGALGRAGEIADGLAELSGSGHAPR